MFKGIKIDNYRGIKQTEITDLSRVNLFFGKNNCGKSSILEAVFLITGQSNPVLPIITNRMRGINNVNESIIALDFYAADPKNAIHIIAEGDPRRELFIELIQSSSHDIVLSDLNLGKSDTTNQFYGIKMSFKLNGNDSVYSSNLVVSGDNTDNAKVNIDKRYKESIISQYITSNYMQNQAAIVESLSKIIKQKQEHDILDVLRIIETRIQNIQVVGSDILVDLGLDKRLPINVLGDGIRKVLSLIVAIFECAGGVLIIDEMDNGLHYSVMPKLWRAIISAANKYDVQLFISTHSIDLLKSISFAFDLNESDDPSVSLYKLIRTQEDVVQTLKYGVKDVQYAISQEIEIR